MNLQEVQKIFNTQKMFQYNQNEDNKYYWHFKTRYEKNIEHNYFQLKPSLNKIDINLNENNTNISNKRKYKIINKREISENNDNYLFESNNKDSNTCFNTNNINKSKKFIKKQKTFKSIKKKIDNELSMNLTDFISLKLSEFEEFLVRSPNLYEILTIVENIFLKKSYSFGNPSFFYKSNLEDIIFFQSLNKDNISHHIKKDNNINLTVNINILPTTTKKNIFSNNIKCLNKNENNLNNNKESLECLTCKWKFPKNYSFEKKTNHLNNCLDKFNKKENIVSILNNEIDISKIFDSNNNLDNFRKKRKRNNEDSNQIENRNISYFDGYIELNF